MSARQQVDHGPAPAIPEGASFSGIVAFRGRACIDGALRGEVIAEGTLVIGEQARVQAQVEADEVVVEGRLDGDAVARQRLELRPGARLVGNVRTPRLVLADGSCLEGRCETGSEGP